MALRLTKTSLPAAATEATDAARAAYNAENLEIQQLVARAGALLAGEDLPGYARMFAEAGALASPHRAYQARKLLIEQGLARLGAVSDRRATEILLALGAAAIEALEQNPAEPVLLNYAGVIMYELWALDAARALFQAARRLDGELAHLERNLEQIELRARSGEHRRLAHHPVLSALTKRARRVAGRAKPASGMRLSLCMIVRDEEEMLPRTLAAASPVADEIIVVDTGSRDRTIEIARSFGATVIERPWTGSFSDARNASLEAATGDWFLYLDADEVLVEEDLPKLRELLGHTWREAFFLQETNFTGADENGMAVVHSALRLMRNRPEYRFSGRLHEQIAYHLPAYLPERLAHSPVRVNHYGYLGVVRESKEKSRRNLELLLAQQRETPAHALNAFFHYNLGSEHFAVGEVEKAIAEFEIALAQVDAEGSHWHEYVPALVLRSIKALRAAGRHEQSLQRADAWLERLPGFTDLVLEQAFACIATGRTDEASSHLRRAIAMGDAPAKYTATVGAGTFIPRTMLATLLLGAGRYEAALEELYWCIENHPEHAGTVYPYATALLKTGSDPAAVVQTIEARMPRLGASGRFMLGTALFEQGHAACAETQFRCVLERQTHSWAARAALVESLMYQRRYGEAAAEAAQMPEDAEAAAVVLRSELFARLLADDLQGAQEALARADRVGLAPSDRGLYAAWLERQRGGEATPPAACLPLLTLMLESLLRVHDFEHFEALLGLLELTPVPERERRELLAGMYLRRGFLRSAAREWMAVCERRPDGRALTGLARVALMNGQAGTAETFAEQALALEPLSESARELRDRARAAAAATQTEPPAEAAKQAAAIA